MCTVLTFNYRRNVDGSCYCMRNIQTLISARSHCKFLWTPVERHRFSLFTWANKITHCLCLSWSMFPSLTCRRCVNNFLWGTKACHKWGACCFLHPTAQWDWEGSSLDQLVLGVGEWKAVQEKMAHPCHTAPSNIWEWGQWFLIILNTVLL